LGYHSDLDLVFLHSGDGLSETLGGERGKCTHPEYFAFVAQRLLSFLSLQAREGHLYRVDTRLRPSGNQGPLVVSAQAFDGHLRYKAALWERQAWVKARLVAGDGRLFERLEAQTLAPGVYERPLPEDAAHAIRHLRQRMEREIAAESRTQLNPKTASWCTAPPIRRCARPTPWPL
jgi:glutamate-ammonia-ligase adenylyltransferase